MAFRELVQTLESMQHMYEELHQLAEKKKNFIIKNEVSELTACLSQESKLLKSLAEHETKVRSAATRLQREMGLRPKLKIAISEIVKLIFNPNEKQELMKLQAGIAAAADKVRKANDHNQQLVVQSLEFVNFSLDVMYGEPEEEAVYKKPTTAPGTVKRTGLFDSRV